MQKSFTKNVNFYYKLKIIYKLTSILTDLIFKYKKILIYLKTLKMS